MTTNDDRQPPESSDLGLQSFQALPDEEGLSLEELSSAYAELLHRGTTPYEEAEPAAASPAEHAPDPIDPLADSQPADVGCDLTPKSILEAMLFVGNASNEPLTSTKVAAMMRGVRPQEIHELVEELNREYDAEGFAFQIASVGEGYLLQLRGQHASLRDAFFGRVKEARLAQSSIDVLAIVAYRQPISREEVDQVRAKPSGGVLSQLLRRGLLRLDRGGTSGKTIQYRTTDRFLKLFGLQDLSELPQSQDMLQNDE